MRLSSNMIGNSNDETNFLHYLLLTSRQVANLCKTFANNSSTDIKLWKTQWSKMVQSGGFLGRLLVPLLKAGLPLIQNVIKPLAKSILIPLGITAAASAADAGIHKKILGASLLGKMFTGKAITRVGYGSKDIRFEKGKVIIRATYTSKLDFWYHLIL